MKPEPNLSVSDLVRQGEALRSHLACFVWLGLSVLLLLVVLTSRGHNAWMLALTATLTVFVAETCSRCGK